MQRIIRLLEKVQDTNTPVNAETKNGNVYISATGANDIYISHDIRQFDGSYITRQVWGSIYDMAIYLDENGIKL